MFRERLRLGNSCQILTDILISMDITTSINYECFYRFPESKKWTKIPRFHSLTGELLVRDMDVGDSRVADSGFNDVTGTTFLDLLTLMKDPYSTENPLLVSSQPCSVF